MGRGRSPRGQLGRFLTLFAAAGLAFALLQLGAYAWAGLRTQRQLAQLQRAAAQAEQATAAPAAVPSPSPAARAAAAPTAALPTATPFPFKLLSPRFAALKEQNPDIVAWLTIPEQLDAPVVQRDDTYYLTRDYLGYHNPNGAIFLDSSCQLAQDPQALILYGHNMKTGAMFGQLRKYEERGYLRAHPLLRCDTQYEEGEYVIFAAVRVRTDYGSARFVNYAAYNSLTAEQRAQALARLTSLQPFDIPVAVDAQDRLLILSTCTGDERERLLVCARRLRPGETAEALRW